MNTLLRQLNQVTQCTDEKEWIYKYFASENNQKY